MEVHHIFVYFLKAFIAFLLWIFVFHIFISHSRILCLFQVLFTTKVVYNENHHIHIIHRKACKCVWLCPHIHLDHSVSAWIMQTLGLWEPKELSSRSATATSWFYKFTFLLFPLSHL